MKEYVGTYSDRQLGIDPPRGVLLYGPPGKRFSHAVSVSPTPGGP